MKEKFSVTGMTCASCQAHVDQAVKKVEGVSSASVSLISKSMVVDFDSSKTDEGKIIAAVEKAGYGASIFQEAGFKQTSEKRSRELKKRRNLLLVSLVFLFLLLFVSMGHMLSMQFSWPFFTHDSLILISLQIVFLLPILIIDFGYFKRGIKALFSLSPNMDSLVALGAISSILYGLYSFIMIIVLRINDPSSALIHKYSEQIYFESAGTILTFVSLGKYFENKATNKTSESISKMMALAPQTALVIRDGKEVSIGIGDLSVGDIALVKPAASVPSDGVIIKGYGNIDESALSGESLPQYKKEGDSVVGGTINKEGSFQMRVEKIKDETALSQIISLVQEAADSKAPLAKMADRIALYFVPIVMGISLLVFFIWLFVSNYDVQTALNYAISVLVISCPCALGLATPVAIMVGTGKGAEEGILLKSAEAFERLNKADVFVFDKTGTLTKGKMEVTDIYTLRKDGDEILQAAASLESLSEHPLSLAVVRKAYEKNLVKKETEDFVYYPGLGISGKVEEKDYLIGNKALLEQRKVNIKEEYLREYDHLSKEGKTVLFVADKEETLSLIGISDTLKETSLKAVQDLHSLDKKTFLLTGDNKEAAGYMAGMLGIDDFKAGVLPSEKEETIRKLQQEGKVVAMVGDGINDAPSLMRADIGIAVGAGTDVAIDAADIVIMKSDLLDVVTAYELSKKVVKNIKMNLFWAFFYNVIAIPLAAGALSFSPVNLTLNPMIASLAMSLSSVTVVLNALRLRLFKRRDIIQKEDKNMSLFKLKKEDGVKQVLSIDGMMCMHCVSHVSEALQALEGVKSVDVNLKKGEAVIYSEKGIKDEVLSKAIQDAGYVLTGVK
jgi:Cu+-exporting ATPase